jgi:fermentation-respiration switch protein FrsA (DUF1100 family)
VVAILSILENRLVFRPRREMLDTPADHGMQYEDVWATTSDGLRIHGWFLHAVGPPKAWLLFSHGNQGNMSGEPVSAHPLVEHGYAVLNYDYRGYGRSEGQPTEAGTYRDGEAMLVELVRRAPGARHVFLYGRSLGGAVSYELAVHHPELGGLITDCSFTDMPSMVRALVAIPGIGRLISTRYDNVDKARRTKLPRLVLHGTHDEVVPLSMAIALRDATQPPADHLWVQGAHHNDTFEHEEYFEAMGRFVQRHLPE